jgi:hypothetical protein
VEGNRGSTFFSFFCSQKFIFSFFRSKVICREKTPPTSPFVIHITIISSPAIQKGRSLEHGYTVPTTNTDPRKHPTKVNHKIKANKPKVVPQADANKIIKNTKKATTDTKCRAFYKFRKRPTTKWALALSAKCLKGIIPIKGPHNAFGDRVRFGTQPCGCRLSRGMTNRSMYLLHPNK